MKNWNELSMTDKNDIIKVAVQNGITTLPEIRERYNEFAEGGGLDIGDVEEANEYSAGGKIHIKDSKKGTFTAAASKHGMGVQAFASRVLAHPENYSPAMRKKANFARNAAKWHGLGGNLYDGESEDSQHMYTGFDWWNRQPIALEDIVYEPIPDNAPKSKGTPLLDTPIMVQTTPTASTAATYGQYMPKYESTPKRELITLGATAAAPFLPSAGQFGLQAMNTAFTPSTWLNPVTGAKLLSPVVGTIADAGVQGAFTYEGLNGLWNQGKQGTLLSDPASTVMHGLEVLPMAGISARGAQYMYNKAKPFMNSLWNTNRIITGVNNSSEPGLFSAYRTIIPKYIDKVRDFDGRGKFDRAIEGFFPILNPTYAKSLAKSPELMDLFELYEFPDFSPAQVKAFQEIWAREAAKGPYSMNGLLKFAKPVKKPYVDSTEDLPRLFEDARQIKGIEDTAYRYGRFVGNLYNRRYDEIEDPVLKHIVDVSPQYINEVYAQHLKEGKATEPFVRHLIQRANNYRRFMAEPHSPEEFGTILGNFRQNGKSTIDVEGMHVSGDYGRFGAYFQGQPTLKGDISTWWDQRIPEGVTVHPGMHSLYPPKMSENLYGDLINNEVRQHGALAMPIERSFWKGYNESDATLNFLHWPTHQVFEGPRGSTLPNFKITLLEDGMPSDFSWGKGYKYGGPLVEYAMGGRLNRR